MSNEALSDGKRNLALFILFLVSTLNFLDRYMFSVLVPSIKTELQLTDTEVGFVTGLAFSLFYATMGVPIARLADRTSRRGVLATAVALWSAMTVATGFIQSFAQLAMARIMMGLGEAGATPPSHAIIADLFPRARRASALAVFGMGSPVGLAIGFIAGAYISQHYGWRYALFAFGVPGVLLAIVVRFCLPAPQQQPTEGMRSLRADLADLFKRKAFVHNTVGGALYALLGLGTIAWAPSFFVRVHQMPIAQVGFWLAIVLGVSQVLGMTTGGLLSDRLAARDLRWYNWMCAIAVILAAPFFVLTFMWPTAQMAMVWMVIPFFLGQVKFGPQAAVTQAIAGPDRRAVAASAFFLINGLAGGAGAQLIGILSDAFRADYGERAIGVAISIIAIVTSGWAGLHFWLASRTLRTDVSAT